MLPDEDAETDEEIAKGSEEFMRYLEECDSKECLYTWRALIEGSVIIYDFREVT